MGLSQKSCLKIAAKCVSLLSHGFCTFIRVLGGIMFSSCPSVCACVTEHRDILRPAACRPFLFILVLRLFVFRSIGCFRYRRTCMCGLTGLINQHTRDRAGFGDAMKLQLALAVLLALGLLAVDARPHRRRVSHCCHVRQ